MSNDRRSSAGIAIAVMLIVGLGAAALYFMRAPIRYAAQIKPGDNAARVHELLGAPAAAFETTAELQASYLGPMSYVFTDRAGRGKIPLSQLPPIIARAEWFEYASAGHLVYYDENGVIEVFWGGT